MEMIARDYEHGDRGNIRDCIGRFVVPVLVTGWLAVLASPAAGSHQGHAGHGGEGGQETTGTGVPIAGASFRVFLNNAAPGRTEGEGIDRTQADAAIKTVVEAFTYMMQHRSEYPRFDEAVKKGLLDRVVIEPTVLNREGKAFPFLVARTADPGRVKLLISASSLRDQGQLQHPEQLVPALAREFQWVVSKADTSPRAKVVTAERDLAHAPIRAEQDIQALSADERVRVLQGLFETYLKTVDDLQSLQGQPYYEIGATAPVPPAQPDSTIKFYDVRMREALQTIARDPYFAEHTPKAVRSLLTGKIWTVAFVNIAQRDWATRTRVLPEENAVVVGVPGRSIQPAAILVNTYRTAAPDDPFYRDTKGLPMGALSADQLARVIALEIEQNIVEKSMSGHVAQDAMTAPK